LSYPSSTPSCFFSEIPAPIPTPLPTPPGTPTARDDAPHFPSDSSPLPLISLSKTTAKSTAISRRDPASCRAADLESVGYREPSSPFYIPTPFPLSSAASNKNLSPIFLAEDAGEGLPSRRGSEPPFILSRRRRPPRGPPIKLSTTPETSPHRPPLRIPPGPREHPRRRPPGRPRRSSPSPVSSPFPLSLLSVRSRINN
jgi:hypothetical protein